jgi:hypothetical protein
MAQAAVQDSDEDQLWSESLSDDYDEPMPGPSRPRPALRGGAIAALGFSNDRDSGIALRQSLSNEQQTISDNALVQRMQADISYVSSGKGWGTT